MPASGSAKPIFYVLGEAPGKNEDETGIQFVGKSGELLRGRDDDRERYPARILDKWLPHTRWNNAINCRPPGNRDPSQHEMDCCRHRVEADIAATKPQVILCFGAVPLSFLLNADLSEPRYAGGRQRAVALARGMPGITQWRGRRLPVRVRGHVCWLYPINHPAWLLHSKNDKRLGAAHLACFDRDLATAFWEYEQGLPKPYVEDPAEFKKNIECTQRWGQAGLRHIQSRLAEIAQRGDVAIDIETNGKRPYKTLNPKILTVAVGNYHDVLAFAIEHSEAQWTAGERLQLWEIFRNFLLTSGKKWAHYLKMEQEWFAYKLGEEILYETAWGDTHAQAHAIDERPLKELEELTQIYFGFNLKDVVPVDIKRLDETPLATVLLYNGLDSKYTEPLHELQAEIIAREGLELVYENLVRLTPSLVRMQLRGLVRNVPEIDKLEKELKEKELKFVKKILEQKDVIAYKESHAKFNPGSNDDVLAFFKWAGFKELKNVDEGALLEVKHPVAALILSMRGERKLSSTYVSPLKDGGKHVATDGLVHATFNQSVTVTTRLASSDPNAQNFPRRERKEIRRVIGCPPGTKFVAMDYGQLEARVVAMCSRDPVLIQETWDGEDIHAVWTEKVGKHFVPKRLLANKKKVRDVIKNLWTFPQFFRSQLRSIALDLSAQWEVDISESALRPFSEEFWDKYKRVLQWQEELLASYWQTGYAATLHGFRRHEPMNENEIVNIPVQGSAAQIVLEAQYQIDRKAYELDRPQRAPIMNVHDDLSFYFLIAQLEEDIEWAAREMCLVKFDWINVPLAVEVSMGDNWTDKTEVHTFISNKDFANG